MTTTETTTTKTTTSSQKPKLLTKVISTTTAAIAMPSIVYPTSPIATGSFYLPIKQKNKRNGRHHKHLRKPPSFDTYLAYSTSSSTTTPCGYLTRTSSVSSSYSSTSSLVDNEDMMCGYGLKSNNLSTTSLPHSPRLRRGSSAYRVRFAEDDGSSIVSSSSGGSEWDDEIDEEEDYILVGQQSSQPQYYGYHEKSASA